MQTLFLQRPVSKPQVNELSYFPCRRAGKQLPRKVEELVREREREQVSRASPGQRSQILKVEPRTQTQNGNGNGNQIYKIAGSTACVIR